MSEISGGVVNDSNQEVSVGKRTNNLRNTLITIASLAVVLILISLGNPVELEGRPPDDDDSDDDRFSCEATRAGVLIVADHRWVGVSWGLWAM